VFRALAYLIFGILLLTIVRSVLGMFGQLFTNLTVGPEKPAAGSRGGASSASSMSTPQTLQKDPVCGTFVAASTKFQKVKEGKTYYFCSVECRDKF
jgi:YHS domain-containing protein